MPLRWILTSFDLPYAAQLWGSVLSLPDHIRQPARKAFFLWKQSPVHSSLHFTCVNQEERVWSVRITLGYRALGIVDGDTVMWFWIGNHQDYERRL